MFKGFMYFHLMTYMATPERKNPCPGCHEVYNFGISFFGHYYSVLGLSMPWGKEDF